MYMGAHVELGVLEYSALYELLLLFGSHAFLLEVEGHVGLLNHDWPIHPVLLLEHSAEHSSVVIVLAALHAIYY